MSRSSHWVENTSLVREWVEMRHEIMRHKWIESEKSGRDIGWDRAFINWLMNHGQEFVESREVRRPIGIFFRQ